MRAFNLQDVRLGWVVLVLVFCQLAGAQSAAEIKGYNDPQTTTKLRLANLPKGLKLTHDQHERLRSLFFQESILERRILWAPGPKLLKRAQIGKIERETDKSLRKLLTKRQYAIFKKKR